MTRDEIIKMARDAGWPASVLHPHGPGADTNEYLLVPTLERFARAAYAAGAAAEREACAKVCEDMSDSDWWPTQCAAAIRARGQK